MTITSIFNLLNARFLRTQEQPFPVLGVAFYTSRYIVSLTLTASFFHCFLHEASTSAAATLTF